jgi:hypothetical protein
MPGGVFGVTERVILWIVRRDGETVSAEMHQVEGSWLSCGTYTMARLFRGSGSSAAQNCSTRPTNSECDWRRKAGSASAFQSGEFTRPVPAPSMLSPKLGHYVIGHDDEPDSVRAARRTMEHPICYRARRQRSEAMTITDPLNGLDVSGAA